jgi:hypothetical protein
MCSKEERMHSRWMLLMIMFCAANIAACATTEVKAVWKDEAYRSQPKRVLVIAMFKSQTISRIVEDEFRNYLKYRGTDTATGYDIFPGNELPSKETFAEQVKAKGFDALLFTRLVGTRTETRTVPGATAYTPTLYAVPMHGYHGSGYGTVYSPAYQVEDRFATVESSLYDVATEKLIWTATSDTWLSEGDQKSARTYVEIMMESLRKQKLFP